MPIKSMENAFSLKGKNAIVTGGNRGLGKSIAEAFAQQGANVAILCRNEESGKAAAAELEKYGGTYFCVPTDVSDIKSCKASTQAVIEKFGKIDILVNNAGVACLGPFLDMDEDMSDWYRVQSIDLNGLAHMCYFVGKHMRDTGGGKVINISSNAADIVNSECMSPYSASKAAVNRLTKCLAYEWGKYGVTVNAIAPGFTWSTLSDAIDPAGIEHICKQMATGRFGEAIEIGALAVYLASPAADQVTGAVVTIDGGYSLAI